MEQGTLMPDQEAIAVARGLEPSLVVHLGAVVRGDASGDRMPMSVSHALLKIELIRAAPIGDDRDFRSTNLGRRVYRIWNSSEPW